MQVWITKYALTSGIREMEVDACTKPSMVKGPQMAYFHGEGRDWHRTRESAIARAEVMRKAKLASLKKTIARIEAINFNVNR